jgi:hypothetical protein
MGFGVLNELRSRAYIRKGLKYKIISITCIFGLIRS